MLQHAFYDGISSLPMLGSFRIVLFNVGGQVFCFIGLPFSISCPISSISSVLTSEKLLMKFKGFCI
jgi:hypothetical protein